MTTVAPTLQELALIEDVDVFGYTVTVRHEGCSTTHRSVPAGRRCAGPAQAIEVTDQDGSFDRLPAWTR